jgi:hypothetical protein
VRPAVPWRELWQALVRFLSFVADEQLVAHPNILRLASKVRQTRRGREDAG